jgi:hypothetical protein
MVSKPGKKERRHEWKAAAWRGAGRREGPGEVGGRLSRGTQRGKS